MGAEPQANRGDWDYESKTKPNAKLDCQPYPQLFEKFPLAALRICLKQVNETGKEIHLNYLLKREIVPVLELEDPEEAPSCVQEVMKTLPVPREIFFQSENEGKTACYNARLSPQVEDSLLSLKKWLRKFHLNISFPMNRLPLNDEETSMLLETWSISPFWNPDRTAVVGRVVPDSICNRCMGEETLLDPKKGLPPAWPTSGR
ncbi:MAG: hypothetical protein HYX41_03400 [Bdellovibrio sp.]|nr:hypothetical protein [Bdellovibrio sp.]